MAKHNELGAWGEQLARDYMIAQGYAVMEQNEHVGHKELRDGCLRRAGLWRRRRYSRSRASGCFM